jgi:hypothetical protein
MPISSLGASAQLPKGCHCVKMRDYKPCPPGCLKSHPTNKVDLPIVPCFEGGRLAAGL